MATPEQADLINEFRRVFSAVHTVEDTMRLCFVLKEKIENLQEQIRQLESERDQWQTMAVRGE